MTQDQRYDMITEMYEATRYAKEIHKKTEKEGNRALAYENIANRTSSKKVRARANELTNKALNNYKYGYNRDSIAAYNKHHERFMDNIDTYEAISAGKDSAARQPGRYEKHEERKPGTYLNAQRKIRGE